MTSVLAEEVKRDNSKFNEIRNFLETCYDSEDVEEILKAIVQKLSAVVETLKQFEVYKNKTVSYFDLAEQIAGSSMELEESRRLVSEQVKISRENLHEYWQVKATGFELLKDIVDNYWKHLPLRLQDAFDKWAKELTIQEYERNLEEPINLLAQEMLESLSHIEIAIANEEALEIVKQVIRETKDERLVKAKLDFVASVFNQEVTEEDNLRLSVNKNVLGLPELYEADFYAWTQEQAKLLREDNLTCLDVPNLLEEIESLGKQQQNELTNRLGVLLGHLLKWDFQPSHRSKSWLSTIREQRRQILRLLKQSPSLKPYLPEAIEEAYESGLDLAVGETLLDYKVFPEKCSYTLEQILSTEFPLNPKS